MVENLIRFSRWYRAPLSMIGLLLIVLAVMLLLGPGSSGTAQTTDATPAADRTSATSAPVCPACGIGQTCDKATGRCVLASPPTPMPCVKGTQFSSDLGYCVQKPGAARAFTPRPTPTATFAFGTPKPTQSLRPVATPDGDEPSAEETPRD